MKCQYCGNDFVESKFHPGNCGSCGAPMENNELLDDSVRDVKGALIFAGQSWNEFLVHRSAMSTGILYITDKPIACNSTRGGTYVR